jgi:two-component system, chemotaxis family, sensor kinase Cph1
MNNFFPDLLSTADWPARWHCGKWTDLHGWLYIISNIAIWFAYFSIPLSMLWFIIRRREDIPFVRVFWLFVFFILACGTSHLMDAIIFWYPAYRLSAFILLITALISWITVIALIKVLPHAIRLKSPAQYEKIISDRTLELTVSNQNLSKLNKDIDNFVYAASHDLKSPVNNLEGLLAMLNEHQGKDKNSDEIISRMNFCVSRMKKTINGLTDIIKSEKSVFEDIENNNIKEIIEEVIKENESLFTQAGTEIIYQLEVETIWYTRIGLKSILYNLIINAVKYRSSMRNSVITIITTKKSRQILLQVVDNGIGIDLPKHETKLFGLFKRFHDHVEGSGLGLYMIKRMIEDRGGKIEVSSIPEKGSTFTVTFN